MNNLDTSIKKTEGLPEPLADGFTAPAHPIAVKLFGHIGFMKIMLSIAVPVMIQFIAEYIFIFSDMAFVGQYDQKGLSAINNVITPFFTVLSFFFAITQGVTIMVSQQIGAKKNEEARHYAESSIYYLVLISVLMGVFWEVFGRWILILIGSKGKILEMGTLFIRIFSLQFISMGFGAAAGAIFQSIGKTFPIMITVIIKSAFNVFLNWIFIFGKFGIPSFGIPGSAIGSAISWILMDFVLFSLLLSQKHLPISISGILKHRKGLFLNIMKLGFPVGIEYILWTLGQVVIVGMINRVDQLASGYFAVLNTLVNLSANIYMGLGVATLVLVGQATGAKKPKDIIRASNCGILYSLAVCVIVGSIFLIMPDSILSIFVTNSAARVSLRPLVTIIVLIMAPKALNIVSGHSIRGTGNTVWMMMTQSAGTVIIILVSYILIFKYNLGIAALAFAVLVDEGWRGIVNELKFLISIKSMSKVIAPEGRVA